MAKFGAHGEFEAFIENGLCKSAHIIGDGILKRKQIHQTQLSHPSYERRYFDELESALQWLKSEGFDTES